MALVEQDGKLYANLGTEISPEPVVDHGLNDLPEYESIAPPNSTTPIVSWKDLTVVTFHSAANYYDTLNRYVNNQKDFVPEGKVILKNLTGQVKGGMHAILGSSGSGKTTLLNALSHRLDPIRMGYSGDIYVNGKHVNEHYLKNFSAYVMQDDVIHAEFTIYETLWYHANLRTGGDLTYEERLARIEELIELLGIEHRKDVIVGDTRNKGISGGERKRLCIAIELLTKPKLLFLDEPTSGLDSNTSLNLISTLRRLTDNNELTVITTIHQPQAKIFSLFHNVTLMRGGEIAYQGNTNGAAKYFSSIGHPAPALCNPADHLLDILSINAHSTKQEAVHFPYLHNPVDVALGSDRPAFPPRKLPNWFFQFGILLLRSLHQHWRRKFVFLVNIISIILITVFIGYASWQHLGLAPSTMGMRPAVLFYCAIHQGLVFSYQSIHIFPLERSIMIRERHGGSYRVSAYFLGKCLADMITQIPGPIIFTLLVYHQVGFQDDPHKFRNFMWLMILGCQAATAMTAMISCIFVSLQVTVVVIAVSFEITRLFGGWFVPPILLTKLYRWKFADALSYLKYTFIGISLNEYHGLVMDCTQAQINAGTICTGTQQIHKYGLQQYTVAECCGVLIGLIVGFRLLSYLALRFVKI